MGHPFGDLLSQHLHRKHGLSQSKLAAGILQDPAVIGKMCKGQRLNGPRARQRVVATIGWLREHEALDTAAEADRLLVAAGMAPLNDAVPAEQALHRQLAQMDTRQGLPVRGMAQSQHLTRAPQLPMPAGPLIGRSQELLLYRGDREKANQLLEYVLGTGSSSQGVKEETRRLLALGAAPTEWNESNKLLTMDDALALAEAALCHTWS